MDDRTRTDSGAEDSMDAVIALYRRDVDVSLLRSRLKLTPEERMRDVMRMQVAVEAMRGAATRRQAKTTEST